ncbi:MAG: putative ABC transporter ATP-binding protein YxlF [candidate division WS2 bacterium]|nr:putative ABC transporter ATP-binding protein YxlF [Candidatus Psychracetigena formicireducens]
MRKQVIQIENLTKVYQNGFKANDQINIHLEEEEIVGIVGPNGAGKTTLIRQILGLLKPTKGKILIHGKDTLGDQRIIKEEVGYVPQIPLSYPAITVIDTIRYALQLEGLYGKQLQQKLDMTLSNLGLESYANVPGYQLSGGLRKMVLLAIALAKKATILLLDEPTSMVDIARKQDIWKLMKRLQKRSILLASHDMNEVKKVCHRIYILVGGRVIAKGSAAEIAQMLKMPVDIEIVPINADYIMPILQKESILWEQEGSLFRISLQELSEGIELLKELINAGGIEYLMMESPSFEKVVTNLVQTNAQ